ELSLGPQENRTLLREILFAERTSLTSAARQRRLDLRLHDQETAVGMAQEHQAHHRQKVFVARVVGVGAQVVGGTPQSLFDRFYMLNLGHSISYPILPLACHPKRRSCRCF